MAWIGSPGNLRNRLASRLWWHVSKARAPGVGLTGANMREGEAQIARSGQHTLLAVTAILLVSLAVVTLGEFFLPGRRDS